MPLKEYDEECELQAIQRRYDMYANCLKITLSRLQNDLTFKQVVEELRIEKWKDWHVLLALFNGVSNWLLENNQIVESDEKSNELVNLLVQNGEPESVAQISIDYFSKENMNSWLNGAIVHILFNYRGAVARPYGYNLMKLRRIMTQKYHFFDLDVPHDSYFS